MPKAEYWGVDNVQQIIEDVYGLSGTVRGDEFDMLCPNPKHDESSPSTSANLSTGYWNCFSCGAGGDLVALGALVLARRREDIELLISPTSPEGKLAALQRRVQRLVAPAPTRRRPVALPDYQATEPLDELRARLFTDATLERYGIRYAAEQELVGKSSTYTIRNSIAIPIRSASGTLDAWCYRATSTSPSWQPRYLYTPGVEVSELWFGLPQAAHLRSVSIVEGALDASWFDQCGFPSLGLLGSNMGERKIRWLQRYDSITLVPDRDAAGVQWMKRMCKMLGTRMPIYIGQYRPWMLKKRPEADGSYKRASDPEDLRPVDVEIIHASARLYMRSRIPSLTR